MNFYIDINSFKEEIADGFDYLDFITGGTLQSRLRFAKQRTGYGFKHFLICPNCGSRRTKLYYYNEDYLCRCCYPINIYGNIQNSSKGGYKYIAYKMKRFADTKGIELVNGPFNYACYQKPAHRKEASWVKDLIVLQALENMRYQSLAFNKRWNTKTVKSVLTWTNTFLYIFDLSDMQDRCNRIFWDKGVDLKIPKADD
jgi:hypothetical protein